MRSIFLLLIALWLFIAPWPTSVPHLIEKITWLQTGHLMAPIDWFDIVLHGILPPAIIGYSIFGFLKNRKAKREDSKP